jgi:hypothetical protein
MFHLVFQLETQFVQRVMHRGIVLATFLVMTIARCRGATPFQNLQMSDTGRFAGYAIDEANGEEHCLHAV